ncbi:cell division protein ZipA [Shewanella algidipiscicola]|uniref:cell division protein ZipA n=1 Tax=Shewanella algidipiscicola TaxID=614070 RepID=UPI000D78369E|nr:cell division protein ZipA [Shewanella algidipiscicola]
MENLQLVLFVLGAIAIIAVLVHGFWSIRRQQPRSLKSGSMAEMYTDKNRDREGFDADGIGAVRVRKLSPEEAPGRSAGDNSAAMNDRDHSHSIVTSAEAPSRDSETDFTLSDTPHAKVSRARQEPVLSGRDTGHNVEPSMGDTEHTQETIEQMELGLGQTPAQSSFFDDVQPLDDAAHAAHSHHTDESSAAQQSKAQTPAESIAAAPAQAETKDEPLGEPQDVLVLHVVANEGETLQGAELLPSLLTLNFKFGDMDIFHRHEDNAGTGKVLFSLANMVKPGVFNPDEMEQFTTQGIVLFMTLPCYGDPLMNFSIMLNSAHQLADDLGGKVLDGGRGLWSEQTKQSYLQRIRAQA